MKLVEGQDYIVRYTPFPNCGHDGAIMAHPDGYACILINSRVCPDRQRKALAHELLHLANDDLFSTDSIEEIEGRMPI